MELKAADVMTPHVVVATPNMSMVEAGKIMNRFRIGGLPVVNKKGELISIITERCIMKNLVAANKKPSRLKVKDVMVKGKMLVGTPGDSVEALAKLMNKHDKTRIPIVDNGKLVGLVTNKDVIENSPALTNLIIEQAQMCKAYDQYQSSVSFGQCEGCGLVSDLFFRSDKFLCGGCGGIDKKKPRFKIFGR
jgi:CBS domain-containing protein